MKDNDIVKQKDEKDDGETELMRRRDFLVGLKKWSKAVIGAIVLGQLVNEAEAEAAWVNRRGSWVNGGGAAWANRGASWANRGASWLNGGGGGWINGGGGWINRRGSWINR